MIDLLKLDDTLRELSQELAALGMPFTTASRVEALRSVIPNIEASREKSSS